MNILIYGFIPRASKTSAVVMPDVRVDYENAAVMAKEYVTKQGYVHQLLDTTLPTSVEEGIVTKGHFFKDLMKLFKCNTLYLRKDYKKSKTAKFLKFFGELLTKWIIYER